VDHNRLNLAATKEKLLDVLRIMTTTINVMTAKPLVFDNTMMHTEAKQILPSIVYPIYCFPWIEIEDGMLAWDES
jgi:NTE family protein